MQGKADKISRIGENVYRISCAINDTDLVVANTLGDVLSLEK